MFAAVTLMVQLCHVQFLIMVQERGQMEGVKVKSMGSVEAVSVRGG